MNQTSFTDKEKELFEIEAARRGVTFEEVVNQLASERIASLVLRRTGKRSTSNVTAFSRSKH